MNFITKYIHRWRILESLTLWRELANLMHSMEHNRLCVVVSTTLALALAFLAFTKPMKSTLSERFGKFNKAV